MNVNLVAQLSLSSVLASWLTAAVLPLAASVSAQAPPAVDPCAPADPARAIHLALADPKLIIAIAEATGPVDLANGTPVRIVRLVKGAFAAPTAIADRQPALACLSKGVWKPGQPVVGVFVVEGEQLLTLAAWPVVSGRAQAAGRSLTVDELLAMGRAYVAPTPTALPPGVPPPPTLVPPDTGPASGLPATGRAGAGGGGGGGSPFWLVGVSAAAAAVTVVGLAFALRRRAGRR